MTWAAALGIVTRTVVLEAWQRSPKGSSTIANWIRRKRRASICAGEKGYSGCWSLAAGMQRGQWAARLTVVSGKEEGQAAVGRGYSRWLAVIAGGGVGQQTRVKGRGRAIKRIDL